MSDRKPFNVKLSAREREALERYRVKFALRSEADCVRHMIEAFIASLPLTKPN